MNTIATVTKRKSDENVDDELLQKITKHFSTEDVKHIENLYSTVLDIKSKLNAAYEEGSLELKKYFESIQLILPENLPSQSTTSSTVPTGSVAEKWMLKHRGPGPRLIELMPDTGIYVKKKELKRTKLKATDMKKFARALLTVVFSKIALRKCSYNGLCKRKRLGLDEYARTVLIAFVTQHATESGWDIVRRKQMTCTLTSKVKDLNIRFGKRREGVEVFKDWSVKQWGITVRPLKDNKIYECDFCRSDIELEWFCNNECYHVREHGSRFRPCPTPVECNICGSSSIVDSSDI